jgi:peptidoglycan/LPS O-acetylase OafA/YrhL
LLEHVGFKSAQYSTDLFSGFHVGGGGVDLFFLISGFIMCHTTANKHQTKGAAAQFIWRRVTRILPLYWLITCFALLVYLMMPGQINSNSGGTDLVASYLLLPTDQVYLVSNGWTLSYEFLFYAVFMLGLFFTRGVGTVLVIALLLMMVIIGMVNPQATVWGDFLTKVLLLEFILGMLVYYYYQHIKQLPLALCAVLIGLGIGALLAVNQGIRSGNHVIDEGLPMVLILVGALGLEPLLQKRPSEFLKSLGDSSYAMYQVHTFVLAAGAMILSKL